MVVAYKLLSGLVVALPVLNNIKLSLDLPSRGSFVLRVYQFKGFKVSLDSLLTTHNSHS